MREFVLPLWDTFWGTYGGSTVALIAGIGIALVVLQFILMIADKLETVYKPRHGGKFTLLPSAKKENNYPALIGAVLGFLAFVQSVKTLWMAVIAGCIGSLIGRLATFGYRWLKEKLTEERKAGEVLLLGEVISLYASAGYTLYDALSASVYMVNLIREPLQKALRSWSQGPQRALKRMGEEINLPEANILIGVLQRAVNIGTANIAELLGQESYTMERIRQYRIEQGLSTRPIIQAAYLIFPGLALVGVTLIPVGYHVAKMIRAIHL